MSTELNNTRATCNYVSLGHYNGSATLPYTLNNISIAYPIVPNYQIVPVFAGTGNYSKPNYNALVKGSCYTYAGINQAYIDCSNPASSQGCSLSEGNCVVYKARPCQEEARQYPPSFAVGANGQCTANYNVKPDGVANYASIEECMARGAGAGQMPSAPMTGMPTGMPQRPLPSMEIDMVDVRVFPQPTGMMPRPTGMPTPMMARPTPMMARPTPMMPRPTGM
jgi:hypothetical protein